MTTLRWLHFTDLHIGQRDEGLWPSAKQAILDDLRRTTKKLGPWDVVLFTGDLAFSGKRSEYAKLNSELKAIWALFAEARPDAAPPVLLAVPGNHDLVWPDRSDPVADQLLGEKSSGREALWSGKKKQLNAVRKWFQEYAAWWDHCPHRPKDLTPGLLPGDFAYTLDKDRVRFAFAGVNSAFVQMFGDVQEGQLWIDPRQLKDACGGDPLAWARDRHFAFLLTHHPPGWLTRDAKRRYEEAIAPAGTFTAHLCGHLHESLAQQTRSGRGEAREIWQGASLFGLEKAKSGTIDRKHGYTAGHLEVMEDGSARTTLWPRLGVKRQDGSWAITADVTYQLCEDLLPTPPEPVQVRRPIARRSGASPAPSPPPPAAAAKTWREAVEQSPLWPLADPALAQAKRVAAEIVSACWTAWQDAERDVPGDPWRDEDLPLRTLARLEALVPRDALSAQETALLVAAPFVREGLFAAGAQWMAADLAKDEPGNLARKILDDMRGARPDLVRRLDKLTGTARAAVEYWLWTRALRQCPQLWEDRPSLPVARDLAARLERVVKDAGAQDFLLLDRLVQLARHVGVSPDVFQAEETIDREPTIIAGGGQLRLSALARLLCAAGAWALELRRADDLVADHAGREGFEVVTARDAIRSARWVAGKDVHRLEQRCADPVVDFVLRDDLVKRADDVFRRLAQDRDARPDLSGGLLDRLPAQLRAKIDIDKGPDGRPRYQVPHVRFQLDHNQIRELLMGEQLYGDPGLAIRELYQNALDACRYRRARVEYLQHMGMWLDGPYEGRIAFRQDKDEDGRAYIECEDSGVGMTAGILEHVFAVAGKRFRDMPEYLEERARWEACRGKIELWPNSRFGIGVLSYFMLADEVRVWTRRFGPEGRLGDALVVHISSASGLFRLEEGRAEVLPDGGTRVRLYLNEASYAAGTPAPSCGQILGHLLWVAEFATSVKEKGKEPMRWQPEVPSPNGQAAPRSRFLPTTSADIWWAACRHEFGAMSHSQDIPLLVDGIATETRIANAMVNLRAGRCTSLSVNRKSVLTWDEGWANDVLQASIGRLVNWEALTMMFLWDLTTHRPTVADRVIALLCDHDAQIPIVGSTEAKSESAQGYRAKLHEIGCLPADAALFRAAMVATEASLFSGWRASIWRRTDSMALQRRWRPAEHLDKMPVLPAHVDDLTLLGIENGGNGACKLRRVHLVFRAIDILREAVERRRPVSEILARVRSYAFLGYEIEFGSVDEMALEDLRRAGERLGDVLHKLLGWVGWWYHTEVSPFEILRLALASGTAMHELMRGLEFLATVGLRVGPCDAAFLKSIEPTSQDMRLLSRGLNAQPPWLAGDIPLKHLVAASHGLEALPMSTVIETLRRFEPLGLRLPEAVPARLDAITPDDLRLLSENLDGQFPWLDSRVPVVQIVRIAQKLDISMAEAQERLTKLAWTGLVLPSIRPDALDTLEGEEPELRQVAWSFWEADVRASRIAEAALKARSFPTVVRIASRLGILPDPLRTAFEAIGPDVKPSDDVVTILRSFEDAPGADPATRFRRGRATARFKIWQCLDAELDAAIARLGPVVDEIVRDPKP